MMFTRDLSVTQAGASIARAIPALQPAFQAAQRTRREKGKFDDSSAGGEQNLVRS